MQRYLSGLSMIPHRRPARILQSMAQACLADALFGSFNVSSGGRPVAKQSAPTAFSYDVARPPNRVVFAFFLLLRVLRFKSLALLTGKDRGISH
jgi:hypothetical protein